MGASKIIKSIVGSLKCHFNHIKHGENCYVGIDVKVVNRGGVNLGNNVIIRPSSGIYTHRSDSVIHIGDRAEIGHHSTISCRGNMIIEDYVLTGPHVFIADVDHQYRDISTPIVLQGSSWRKGDRVWIERGTWLGTNAVIVGNVHIGKNCVIGANSVVTKDIPDYCVAVGSPAKVIKKYNLETQKWEKVK